MIQKKKRGVHQVHLRKRKRKLLPRKRKTPLLKVQKPRTVDPGETVKSVINEGDVDPPHHQHLPGGAIRHATRVNHVTKASHVTRVNHVTEGDDPDPETEDGPNPETEGDLDRGTEGVLEREGMKREGDPDHHVVIAGAQGGPPQHVIEGGGDHLVSRNDLIYYEPSLQLLKKKRPAASEEEKKKKRKKGRTHVIQRKDGAIL